MSLCVSGHENPAGAVYCTTCGKDLTLEATISGRQCIHGHPMSTLDETCQVCGNLPVSEAVPSTPSKSLTSKTGILAKLELSDMQEDARATLRKIRTKFKINFKIFRLVLILIIAIPVAYFGYTVYAGPNYKGKTVEEVFKNREDQINAVLQPTCNVGKSEISAAESEITSTSESIAYDYKYALGYGVSVPSAGDVRAKIRDEVERQLKAALGDKYVKLDNASAVISSGEDSAIKFCGLAGALTGLREKSSALEQTVNDINSPGYWAGSDYYYDDEDPNIAWKNAPRSAYPSGGWAVDVISRLGCSGRTVVTIDGMYGDYYGSVGSLGANQRARVDVLTGFYYISESGSVSSVTCN